MSMDNSVSRRHFFFGSLLAGAVPLGGYGSVTSLKALGYKPYYDKLNVASVGCGGRGGVDLNEAAKTENIIALCDVDEKRASENFTKFSKQPKYKDFRVMIEKEKDIEAVTIGIPDHMHAEVALFAMQHGKHVYCEKPLTRTPWEARLLADAAIKYKVATQMGNQGYSHESIRVAAEMIWSGAIGDVTEVHASASPGTHPTGLKEPPPEKPVPNTLDWDLWLGDAAMRPYSDEFTPYNWHGFFDFGTGQIGNWGIHTMGPVNLALQLGAPTSVEMVKVSGASKYSFPDRAVLKFEFPARGGMKPVSVYWHDSAKPGDPEAYIVPGMEKETILPTPENLAAKGRGSASVNGGRGGGGGRGRGPRDPNAPRTGAGGPGVPVYGPGNTTPPQPGILTGNGAVFVGTKGIMSTIERGEGVKLLPEERWKDYVLPSQILTRSPGHMTDWARFCKGGEPSCSNFAISGPYTEWMLLGVIAFRVPGKLEWDSRNLRFTNSVEANKYVKPVFRKGWELKL
jgi:predicted dehydrogenase